MKTLKETGITFIIMLIVTFIIITFGLKDFEGGSLSDIETEYCQNAFNALPYDEFIRETKANWLNCNL